MITPDQQCKGHGKQAILAAIRLMLDAGAKRIVTMCKPANSVAFGLYTKLGFAEAGTLEDGDTLLVLPRDTAQSLCRRL